MPSLAETPLPPLLLGLHRERFSGRLRLASGALRRSFEWREGMPVGLSSSIPSETLCELLVRQGALRPELRRQVAETAAARGLTELQALAGLGAVAPRVLVLALAEQLRQALLRSLGWREGSFELEPAEARGASPALPLDLLAVLHAGIAASWQSHEVLVALGERATRFATLRPGQRLDWLPAEGPGRALAAALDGTRPAFAAVQELAAPEAAAALWMLDRLDALTWSEAPAPASDTGAATPAAARIEIVVRGEGEARAAGASARAGSARGREAASPDHAELRREIETLHGKLRELPLWGLLGVEPSASAADVRRAYLRAAKRLHPDRIVQLGLGDLREMANEVFAEIAHAHEVLSDPEQRKHYEETFGGAPLADADRIAEAEAAYVRGEHLLRAGNFRGALEFLERAVVLWPDEADYQAALGWALHRKEPPDSERGLSHLERAFGLGSDKAVWWLRASLVARALGRDARANELAARARAIDPNVKA